MNQYIEELMAMGYTRQEAEQIYRTGSVSTETANAADQRAYDEAEEKLGANTANKLTFLQDPYNRQVSQQADQGVVEQDAQFDNPSNYGTAVPSYMSADYDPEFTYGGGENPQPIDLKPTHPAYTPSNTTNDMADGADAEGYNRIDGYRGSGMSDDEIRKHDPSVAHLLPSGEDGSIPVGGYEGSSETEMDDEGFQPTQPVSTFDEAVYEAPVSEDPELNERLKYQRDLLQARLDTSATLGDNVGEAKFNYRDYTPMSRGNRVFQSMLTYGLTYLATGGDAEKGLQAALEFNNIRNDREHRYGQVQYLESRGYNPKDINSWILDGDEKTLVKDKDAWQSAGGGRIYNTRTGEVKDLGGKKVEKTFDLGDRVKVIYSDGSTSYEQKGMTPAQANKAGLGSGGAGGAGGSGGYSGKMTADSDKARRLAYENASVYQSAADSASDLARRLDESPHSRAGFSGKIGEAYHNFFGTQDDVQMMKSEYDTIRNSAVIASMPPGPASDNDVKIFSSGFPTKDWAPKKISQWLRGRAKTESYRAALENMKADYITENNGLGKTADGQTFSAYASQWKKQYNEDWKANNPQTDSKPTGGSGNGITNQDRSTQRTPKLKKADATGQKQFKGVMYYQFGPNKWLPEQYVE